LFWEDNTPGNHEIYYAKSTDEGSTWTANRRLTWTSGISEDAAAVVNSIGHLNLVWHDNTSGGYEVYYRKSTDEGSTWTASRRLTWTSGVSECPALAVDSSDFPHMFWGDNTPGDFEIYYRKSTDGGVTWTANQRLTWNSGNSLNPAIAVDSSDFLHMFWEDDTPGNFEIYYRKSLNGGAAWTANQRLTWNSGNSLNPAIAVDASGNLHVVWEDATAGNLEIYYKRGK
jgi:hypothetical protein